MLRRVNPAHYLCPGPGKYRARMLRLLEVLPEDSPIGSWKLISGFLNPPPENRRLARMRTQRIMETAEACGFIRRLPVYGNSPNLGSDGHPKRERLWVLTDEGKRIRDMYRTLN